MTDSEYEEAYREALLCLPDADVGGPQAGPTGERICYVNRMALTDHQVFELAWGPRIADQIRRERESLEAGG